ncbi:MAG: 30S ribosomal protein S20 [Rickettsiales bacterium]|jgi:small subunit ribosomal protein S20|nr:30S ribosomal protein S20 [Rickettsiales bacterium]
MAHHAAAKKAIRQNVKQNARNKSRSSDIKTFVKKVEEAVASNDSALAQDLFKSAQAKIMKGAKKNLMKPNTASRKVSRLAKKVKAIEAA